MYAQDSGYCDPDLCTDSWGRVTDHIGCPGVAKDECPKDARWIPIEKELRKLVLDKHNGYRNKLAGGELSGFPSAKRMPTIVGYYVLSFFPLVKDVVVSKSYFIYLFLSWLYLQ